MKNKNKAAFARPWSKIKQHPDAPEQVSVSQQGMTLREYYAGQALQGLLAGGFNIHDDAAKVAAQFADDMIEALGNES